MIDPPQGTKSGTPNPEADDESTAIGDTVGSVASIGSGESEDPPEDSLDQEDLGKPSGVVELTYRPMTREHTRRYLAFFVLGLVGALLIFPFFIAPKTDAHWDFLRIGLSGLIGILGTTVAFFFRGKT